LYATELDVDGLTDLEQVHGYMKLFPLFWEHPSLGGITLWGFRPGMWRSSQGAYLIDEFGKERPAMLWLRAYLKNQFVPDESIMVYTAGGESSITTKNGTLQMLAEVLPDTATLKTVHWTVSDTRVATITADGLLYAVSDGTITVKAASLELGSNVSDQMVITVSGQTSGIESIPDEEYIKVYPNPVNEGCFTVDGMQDILSVTVLDINGRQILSCDFVNRSSVEIVPGVPAGLYIVRLSDGKRFYHAKIIIR